MMKYRGVAHHPGEISYKPIVSYRKKWYWLKTFRDAETAARVRDIAYYWLRGKSHRLNFPEILVPENVAPAQILRWMLDAGIPLKEVLPRIPVSILSEAGITSYDLLMAGVSAADAVNYLRPSCE